MGIHVIGCDCHRNFSKLSARDAQGQIAWRTRLEHRDRRHLRKQIRSWPAGTPVVLEATFGWGWLSDELQAAGLEPRLASSSKVAGRTPEAISAAISSCRCQAASYSITPRRCITQMLSITG